MEQYANQYGEQFDEAMEEVVKTMMKEGAVDVDADEAASSSMFADILREIFYSPMNLGLLAIICFLLYKIVRDRTEVPNANAQKLAEPELPKLRRDFTVPELRKFDGTQPDGRVLVAVNGTVYDVTKGKRFYGPGGPYASFAGRDASRNLATFSVSTNEKLEYDDLSDLSGMEMDSVREWEMQFKEKYDLVGRLLRKGEQPNNYDDEEEDDNIVTVHDIPGNGGPIITEQVPPIVYTDEEMENLGVDVAGLRKRHANEKDDAAKKETDATKSNLISGTHISLGTDSKTNIADGDSNSTTC